MVELSKLKSPAEWPQARIQTESLVLDMLGKIPKQRVEVQVTVVDEVEFPGYVRRRINYFVDDWNRTTAWLFLPNGKEAEPTVLCCHQEVPQGKDEPAGLEGDPNLAFAKHYAELGYVTLAPDCVTAGERISSQLEPYDTKSFYKDNPKMSMVGKMLTDHVHGIDALLELDRVDPERIGVIGHGLGGLNALMLAAFDERITACVTSCGFTRFATDTDPARWARDEGMVLLPKLKPMIENKSYTFDWEHILALAAPTATLVITSTKNAKLANPKSAQKAVTDAHKLYKLLGAGGALEHFAHPDGHCMSPAALEMADAWLERWI